MHPHHEPWPPAGIQVLRRSNPAGGVHLPAIADHRVSLHLSHRTTTTCRESGRQFVRRRGHADLTPACSTGGFDADDRCDSIEVRLPVGFLARVAEQACATSAAVRMSARHLVEEPRLTHLLLAIDAEHRAGLPGGRLFMDSLGIALAVQLLAGHATPPSLKTEVPGTRQVQRAVDFIEAHLDKPLSLDQLAAVAGISSSGLQRCFKALKGESVHRYVVRRRVERARVLLMQRLLPASEVALAAGFSHQSHMARWMRRMLGMAPHQIASSAKADLSAIAAQAPGAPPMSGLR
jgi:AraC family transcriptional regulator